MMASISTLYNITACAAGEGNQDEINKAVSPKGLLEYIINFFTFGGVRRDNKELYRQIDNNIMRLINSPEAMNECSKTGVITLDDIHGNKVTFTLPGNNNENGMVTVTVSKGKNMATGEIPGDKFKFPVTTQWKQDPDALNTIDEDNVIDIESDDDSDDYYYDYNYHRYDGDVSNHFKTLCVSNTRFADLDSDIVKNMYLQDIEAEMSDIIREGGIFS